MLVFLWVVLMILRWIFIFAGYPPQGYPQQAYPAQGYYNQGPPVMGPPQGGQGYYQAPPKRSGGGGFLRGW